MKKQEYYRILEDFGIMRDIPTKIKSLEDILEVYPTYKTMTLEEVIRDLRDRQVMFQVIFEIYDDNFD